MKLTSVVLPLAVLLAAVTLSACQERTPQAQGRDCARAARQYLPDSWRDAPFEVAGDDWTDLSVKLSRSGQAVGAHCTFRITKFGASLDEMTVEGFSPWPAQVFDPATRLWLTEAERQRRIRNDLSPRDGQYRDQTWEPGWGPFGAGINISGRCWQMLAPDTGGRQKLLACQAEQGFRVFVFGEKGLWIEIPGLPPGVPDPGPNKMEDGAPAPPVKVVTWGPDQSGPFQTPAQAQEDDADESSSAEPASDSGDTEKDGTK